MDYKQKYKDALERAKNFHSHMVSDGIRYTVEEIFPELKESDDERVRKGLIQGFNECLDSSSYPKNAIKYWHGIVIEDILAWLEKQGKSSDQIHYWTEEEIEPIISDYLRGTEHYGGMIGRLRCLKPKFLEKQGDTSKEVTCTQEAEVGNGNIKALVTEKIPFDKVEPKFHRGDWITNGRYAKRIVGINNDWPYYMFEDGTAKRIKDIDERYHLWTIQDAKDGDVLVDENVNVIGIFEGIEGMCWHSKFYYSNTTKEFYGIECGGSHQKDFAKPATKEQRELLFQKMHEAGYEWDAEKNELKIKLKEPDVYEYELERIVDKLNEVIGKLGDIHEVLSKPYVFPYRDYTPPSSIPGMDVWYTTHGVEKIIPVTCETTTGFNKSEDNESK